MDRPAIPQVGAERELLLAHLAHARATFRWKCEGLTALHMLDEVARHNGHADIIRESIDGTVGY